MGSAGLLGYSWLCPAAPPPCLALVFMLSEKLFFFLLILPCGRREAGGVGSRGRETSVAWQKLPGPRAAASSEPCRRHAPPRGLAAPQGRLRDNRCGPARLQRTRHASINTSCRQPGCCLQRVPPELRVACGTPAQAGPPSTAPRAGLSPSGPSPAPLRPQPWVTRRAGQVAVGPGAALTELQPSQH